MRFKEFICLCKKRGINISAMSRATDIPRSILHMSLSTAVTDQKRRPLKDDELIKVCKYLEVNPMDFADQGAEGR